MISQSWENRRFKRLTMRIAPVLAVEIATVAAHKAIKQRLNLKSEKRSFSKKVVHS